jgi:hypothetical protein
MGVINYGKKFKNILFICIISCKNNDINKSDIELTILNDTLFAYSFEMKRDTINFLRFEISNNSNKIYYINDIVNGGRLYQKSVYKERVQLRIFNANNEEVEYRHIAYYNDHRYNSDELNNCFSVCEKINVLDSERRFSISDKPNYYYYGYKYNKSFFIHPKEKLYFEIYLNITDTLLYESERIGYAELSKNTSYRGQVSIVSDTPAGASVSLVSKN